jgi:hypothetical protein
MNLQSKEATIADMLAEIVLDIDARKVRDDTDPVFGAYLAAILELHGNEKPDMEYVHNVLAHALNKPLATRH